MKAPLFLILSVFLFGDAFGRKSKRNGNKIVGGYDVTIEDFPYQVLLFTQKNDDLYECGGSIISRNHILTAAHCLAGISMVYVKPGSTSPSSDSDTIVSRDFIQHPRYNASTYDFDVGIVTLPTPLEIDGVTKKIVRLAKSGTDVKTGSTVTVSGWGATSEAGEGSDTLLAVDVPVVDQQECRRSYRRLTDRMFCAGYPSGGKDSCQGDSGGPAVLRGNGLQVGIVSYGIGCARPGYPGVYARVAHVRDWIKEVAGV